MDTTPLERDSSAPLYIQLKERIRQQVQAGVYPAGARLPSERELAQEYHISRLTARQALQALIADGLAYSRVGKGTYVSAPKIDNQLQALTSFSEDMHQRGMDPSSVVIHAGLEPVDGVLAEKLQLKPDDQVAVLSRVRLADGEPLALETAYLVAAMCPNILNGHDFCRESLYQVLRRDYGLALVRAEEVIEARQPHERERQLLELDRRTPVLSISRLTFTDLGEPVEFVRAVYRGDQYRLHVTLRGVDEHNARMRY